MLNFTRVNQIFLEDYTIKILGDNFKYIIGNGLYLSGSNYNTNYVDLYSEFDNLSAFNPPFSGIPITDFEIINNNELNFNLPKNLPIGKYDVIFCNPAGYYKASSNRKFKLISVFYYDNKILTFINGTNLTTLSGVQLMTISKYIIEDE